MSGYRAVESMSGMYEFHGPGLGYHGCPPDLHLISDYEKDKVLRILAQAYEAGRKVKSAELRRAIGVE